MPYPVHSQGFTVGSMFAGIGGFCLAFKKVGFDISWANEKDSFAAATYRHNFPEVQLFEKCATKLSVTVDALEPVDVLTAGFPCQSFSVAGSKGGFSDPRGKLFFEVIRVLKEFGRDRPKIVLLENVKHLQNHNDGKTFARITTELQQAGYWFTPANATVLNTRDQTRIPQNRERLFMVALSWDAFDFNDFRFPGEEHGVDDVRSYLDLDRRADDDLYFQENSKYWLLFREAIDKGDPNSVYHLRRHYVRENKSDSVFTLTANMGDGGHNVPVIQDNWGIRKLSPAECARLQGFNSPDFSFPDGLSKTQRYKQVGNAVTVTLVQRLAQECLRKLQERQETESDRLELST